MWWRLLFWPAWRLPDRAVAVVVEADQDRDTTIGRPEGPAGVDRWDSTAPAWVADPVGTDQPDSKSRVLIVGATQDKARGVAEVLVLVPVGGKEAVTAEVRDLASARQADLVPDKGMDSDEVKARILVRAGVKGCIPAAARNLASVKEVDLVKAWARVLVRVEVKGCIPVVARNLASVKEADLVEAWARVLVRAEVKECILDMARNLASAGDVDSAPDRAEVRDQVAVRALALAGDVDSAPVADRVEVRTLAETASHVKMDQDEVKGQVAGSDPIDVPVSIRLPRSNRNRKFQ